MDVETQPVWGDTLMEEGPPVTIATITMAATAPATPAVEPGASDAKVASDATIAKAASALVVEPGLGAADATTTKAEEILDDDDDEEEIIMEEVAEIVDLTLDDDENEIVENEIVEILDDPEEGLKMEDGGGVGKGDSFEGPSHTLRCARTPLDCRCPGVPWLWSHTKSSRSSPRSGKWLLFCATPCVDAVWARVAALVQQERLGPTAKVSTGGSTRGDRHIICVYTYDYSDVADVMRVLCTLRDCIVSHRYSLWSYKTDDATMAGTYSSGRFSHDEPQQHQGSTKKSRERVSMYNSPGILAQSAHLDWPAASSSSSAGAGGAGAPFSYSSTYYSSASWSSSPARPPAGFLAPAASSSSAPGSRGSPSVDSCQEEILLVLNYPAGMGRGVAARRRAGSTAVTVYDQRRYEPYLTPSEQRKVDERGVKAAVAAAKGHVEGEASGAAGGGGGSRIRGATRQRAARGRAGGIVGEGSKQCPRS